MLRALNDRAYQAPENVVPLRGSESRFRANRGIEIKIAQLGREELLLDRLRPHFGRISARRRTGRLDDRAFYDELSGGL